MIDVETAKRLVEERHLALYAAHGGFRWDIVDELTEHYQLFYVFHAKELPSGEGQGMSANENWGVFVVDKESGQSMPTTISGIPFATFHFRRSQQDRKEPGNSMNQGE